MSKVELHKSESFQFDNLCPESKYSKGNVVETTTTAGVPKAVLPVGETGLESGKQEGFPVVEVIQAVDQMVGVVEPVLLVQETGLKTGKQQETAPGVEVTLAEDQLAGVHLVESVLDVPVHETCPESGKQEKSGAMVDAICAEDQTAGVTELVLPVHENGWESGNQDDVPVVEIMHVEDQSTIKPEGNSR